MVFAFADILRRGRITILIYRRLCITTRLHAACTGRRVRKTHRPLKKPTDGYFKASLY